MSQTANVVQDVGLVPARRQGCRTQPMFTYWRRVCRHGAGRTPSAAPPSKHTSDETLQLPSFSRAICTNEFVYTNSRSVGGFVRIWPGICERRVTPGLETGGAQTTSLASSCQILWFAFKINRPQFFYRKF